MPDTLHGKRLLIVEDEYLIAADLAEYFEQEEGAIVVGPAATVAIALALLDSEAPIDGAVLDINLRGGRSFPIADRLLADGVGMVFTTGYEALAVPEPYAAIPRIAKPADRTVLVRKLLKAMATD